MKITPSNGLELHQDTEFSPGVYYLPNGISVLGSNITIKGDNTLLIGDKEQGQGLRIKEQSNVTIDGLQIQNFYHGITAEDCSGLTIKNCRITATAEIPANTIFLDIWLPAEQSYGGAILLKHVSNSAIQRNDLQHQMNGLLAYHCHNLEVRDNLGSYNSGFGFHLYGTKDSHYINNYADFCSRYQPRGEGVGHMGADAAGFLIVYNSSGNTFLGNYARSSGDGFFLAGMTPEFEPVGCDENLFEGNDASYSPNNGFEGVFSKGNVFKNNKANFCNYGFWLGFSRQNQLQGNQMIGNRQAGIAVENGFTFEVRDNQFQGNGHGILLWSKYVKSFYEALPDNHTSYDWDITRNNFVENRKAIRIAANQDHGVRPLPQPEIPLQAPHNHAITRNQFTKNGIAIETLNVENTKLAENKMVENLEDLVKG